MSTDQKSKRLTLDLEKSLAVAHNLAKNIKPPFTIELSGDLGGGKTTFVKGLAKGLGISKTITSPTFTIRRIYTTPNNLVLDHYDLYRLDEDRAVLEELKQSCIDKDSIVVIEWGEEFEKYLPKDRLKIEFEFINQNLRQLNFTSSGTNSSKLLEFVK